MAHAKAIPGRTDKDFSVDLADSARGLTNFVQDAFDLLVKPVAQFRTDFRVVAGRLGVLLIGLRVEDA